MASALFLGSYELRAESSRPNAVSMELLGRGLAYGLNYDRLLTDDFALGAGMSYYNSDGSHVWVIPVYGSYYFLTGNHRPFLTAGVDIISLSIKTDLGFINASGIIPIFGAGYEYRSDGGFLFRATPYVVFGNDSTAAWIGLTFGYAF